MSMVPYRTEHMHATFPNHPHNLGWPCDELLAIGSKQVHPWWLLGAFLRSKQLYSLHVSATASYHTHKNYETWKWTKMLTAFHPAQISVLSHVNLYVIPRLLSLGHFIALWGKECCKQGQVQILEAQTTSNGEACGYWSILHLIVDLLPQYWWPAYVHSVLPRARSPIHKWTNEILTMHLFSIFGSHYTTFKMPFNNTFLREHLR